MSVKRPRRQPISRKFLSLYLLIALNVLICTPSYAQFMPDQDETAGKQAQLTQPVVSSVNVPADPNLAHWNWSTSASSSMGYVHNTSNPTGKQASEAPPLVIEVRRQYVRPTHVEVEAAPRAIETIVYRHQSSSPKFIAQYPTAQNPVNSRVTVSGAPKHAQAGVSPVAAYSGYQHDQPKESLVTADRNVHATLIRK